MADRSTLALALKILETPDLLLRRAWTLAEDDVTLISAGETSAISLTRLDRRNVVDYELRIGSGNGPWSGIVTDGELRAYNEDAFVVLEDLYDRIRSKATGTDIIAQSIAKELGVDLESSFAAIREADLKRQSEVPF